VSTGQRKVVYVLGAGFSYGTNHKVKRGQSYLMMPLQNDLLEKIFQYHCKTIKTVDKLAKVIREYFSPQSYRSRHNTGASRHQDLLGLSVEEIVTFFEEMARDSEEEKESTIFRKSETELRKLTLQLIEFLSIGGKPNQNIILKQFRSLILDTDTIITFNWDTLLDRVLANNKEREWHPAWGYGRTVNKIFEYSGRLPRVPPRKHATLLKLHGSINWIACAEQRTIQAGFSPKGNLDDVVMMPPKMLKREIWGEEPTELKTDPLRGNWAVHADGLYPDVWREAESAMSRAKRIVFIGYSFPAADTSVYGLIRRSLAIAKITYGAFPNIHIVDPNAAVLSERFQRSFKIQIPIQDQFLSLSSYVLNRDRK